MCVCVCVHACVMPHDVFHRVCMYITIICMYVGTCMYDTCSYVCTFITGRYLDFVHFHLHRLHKYH